MEWYLHAKKRDSSPDEHLGADKSGLSTDQVWSSTSVGLGAAAAAAVARLGFRGPLAGLWPGPGKRVELNVWSTPQSRHTVDGCEMTFAPL